MKSRRLQNVIVLAGIYEIVYSQMSVLFHISIPKEANVKKGELKLNIMNEDEILKKERMRYELDPAYINKKPCKI